MAKDLLEQARKEINEVDKEMAELFVRRMRAAELVAQYKKERGLSILDEAREMEVIRRNSTMIEDDQIREYYVRFLRDTVSVSRMYQSRLMEGMKIAYSGTEGAFAHIAACKLYHKEKYTDAAPYLYYLKSRGHAMVHPETDALLGDMLLKLKEEGEDAAFAYVRREILKKK